MSVAEDSAQRPPRIAAWPEASAPSPMERILRHHREGLARFATVIDGNPHYDALLAHRLKREEVAAFSESAGLAERRVRAIALAENDMRKHPAKLLRPAWRVFVCDGRTSNNLREFEFFEQICAPIGLKILPFNYATAEKVPHPPPDHAQQDALERLLDEVRAFYEVRSNITASLVHQQILYSKSFFNHLLSFTSEEAVLPAALVQANDHSPSRVALSMVMKGLGIPRIYLQHAEVSEHFPPLDFEYSVLRNRRSLAVYETIGPVEGRPFVIPRATVAPPLDALCRTREGNVRVVIYPTSRVDIDALRDIITRLKRNDSVSEVLLKQHPGAARPLEEALAGTGVAFADDFPEDDHVALVGNSSVAIELLARGIPVYQNFDFDPIDRDYYGFVRAGLTFDVPTNAVEGAFWKPYAVDEAWRAMFAEWVPGAVPDAEDEAEFVAAMRRLVPAAEETPPEAPLAAPPSGIRAAARRRAKRATLRVLARRPRLSGYLVRRIDRLGSFLSQRAQRAGRALDIEPLRTKPLSAGGAAPSTTDRRLASAGADPGSGEAAAGFVAFTLGQVRNPAEWIALNEQVGIFPCMTVIQAIEKLLQDRNASLKRVFEEFPTCPTNSVLGTWLYLRRSERTNMEILPQELERIAAFVDREVTDRWLKRQLEIALFPAVINYGTVEQLDRLIAPGSSLCWDQLSFNRRIQVLKKVRVAPGREDEAERLSQDMLRRASELEKLKIFTVEFLEGRLIEDDWSHQSAEEAFARAAPRLVAEEFAAQVRPVYDALRPRMRLMEVRSVAAQRKSFIDRVRGALDAGTAFSCLRVSDREGYLFPEGGHFGAPDIGNCERHWWGTELAPDLRARIVAEAREAIGTADVVGIPSIYRFIRDTSDRSVSLFSTLQGRGVVDVLGGVREAASETAVFSEDKFNVGLFLDPKVVSGLAAAAERVVVVGSALLEYLPAELRECATLEHVPLPTHHKTSLNDRYVRGADILPLAYPALVEAVEARAGPRTLVLVAGGLVGKIFIGRARAKGAVVLDIGHVLDDWINSRPPTIR